MTAGETLSPEAQAAMGTITQILDPLTAKQRRRVVAGTMREEYFRKQAEIASARAKAKANEEKADRLEKAVVDLEEIEAIVRAPALQRVEGSVYHKLRAALRDQAVAWPLHDDHDTGKKNIPEELFRLADADVHAFVVEHDWASAFANARDFADGEYRCGYDFSCFEFRIADRRVCAVLANAEGKAAPMLLPFAQLAGGWSFITAFNFTDARWVPASTPSWLDCQPFGDFIGAQIRAICIALEAEVAVSEVVRAPHKLNAKRARQGKLPILDYHRVSLAHRKRVARLPPAAGAEERRKVRLHFRRGHWRHFVNHKTWIKWMLVGSPDIGFVDKEYRL